MGSARQLPPHRPLAPLGLQSDPKGQIDPVERFERRRPQQRQEGQGEGFARSGHAVRLPLTALPGTLSLEGRRSTPRGRPCSFLDSGLRRNDGGVGARAVPMALRHPGEGRDDGSKRGVFISTTKVVAQGVIAPLHNSRKSGPAEWLA